MTLASLEAGAGLSAVSMAMIVYECSKHHGSWNGWSITGLRFQNPTTRLRGLRDFLMQRRGAGKNDAHGDGGQRAKSLEGQVDDLEAALDSLKRNQGSRAEKKRILSRIKKLKEEADKARKGETHHRRG